jgi:polysaccharide biosynthesis transport protein
MLDIKDFSFTENQTNFDFKGYLIRIGSYWQLFLACLVVCFFIAYQLNIRKQNAYIISNSLTMKEQNNPFFTSNTSLVFNWGGSSDKMQSISSKLKSRSHNEEVVNKLQFFIEYLKEDRYFNSDVYGDVPFSVSIDKSKGQLLNQDIKVKFLSANKYQIKIEFDNEKANLFNYSKNASESVKVGAETFKKDFNVGQKVALPFLNWKLEIKNDAQNNYSGKEFIVKFNEFDQTVSKYQTIKVVVDKESASILNLSLEGTNKAKLVDYLNTTVKTLIDNELEAKNLFATNTIRFIDSTLVQTDRQLKLSGDELENFQSGTNVLDLESGGKIFSEEIQKLDFEKEKIDRKISYCNSLKAYLTSNNDFSRLPAPSVAGIEDPNILVNTSKLINLSIERSKMPYTIKSEKLYADIDNEIYSYKKILLENLNSFRNSINYDLNIVTANLNAANGKIRQLPESQQKYSKIQRKLILNEGVYSSFLAKKSEAEIVKAANLSDIHFLDTAKDTGGGLIGSRTDLNYVLAFLLGIFIPLILITIIFVLNTSVQSVDDIGKLTKIPLIGVIGKKQTNSNLAVFDKPKSPISEAFRSIRSSLQFIYKKKNIQGGKTLMVTSSVGGEGKTFCSINIATVFALSEKKTVIVGLDLRKPKIFEDFDLTNEIGVVNYIIGEKTIDQIIMKTKIPNLDVITSGPIPPNPSEMIMSDAMSDLILDLKAKYDYIILDTPPVGLVTDAIELAHFSDVTLYVVRQNYTKKEMITLLNNREQRGELDNISIVLNGFENKARYGYAYGYGYDYGYGNYSNGYHDVENNDNFFQRTIKNFLKK